LDKIFIFEVCMLKKAGIYIKNFKIMSDEIPGGAISINIVSEPCVAQRLFSFSS
jgi:hypothetical protein